MRLRLLPFRSYLACHGCPAVGCGQAEWQMTLFLTAHRRDHRLAAPLTASLPGARWAALLEGRRRHRDTRHDSASGELLPGGPRRRVLELCYYRALLRRSSSRVSCLVVGPNDGPF